MRAYSIEVADVSEGEDAVTLDGLIDGRNCSVTLTPKGLSIQAGTEQVLFVGPAELIGVDCRSGFATAVVNLIGRSSTVFLEMDRLSAHKWAAAISGIMLVAALRHKDEADRRAHRLEGLRKIAAISFEATGEY